MSTMGRNVKVHFAGCDADITSSAGLTAAGVNYQLYTVFPFIHKAQQEKDFRLPKSHVLFYNQKYRKHVIQDSGLFTLMFGAEKEKIQTKESLTAWQNKLMSFVIQNGFKCTCVEIDCQKLLGPKEAWWFRERMKKMLPNRQINVFHVEDGKEGLKSLIDFSDYIAISVPEIRIVKPKTYADDVTRIAYFIKNRKPEIDIHLLGCTEKDILKKTKFATTADSTSWLCGRRYGRLEKRHVSALNEEKLSEMQKEIQIKLAEFGLPNANATKSHAVGAISAKIAKKNYENWVGPQD